MLGQHAGPFGKSMQEKHKGYLWIGALQVQSWKHPESRLEQRKDLFESCGVGVQV